MSLTQKEAKTIRRGLSLLNIECQVTFMLSYVMRKEVKRNKIFTVALALSQRLDHSITADVKKELKILKTQNKTDGHR
jgi:hypothetical protein